MPKTTEAIEKQVRDLLARAVDPAATEEEQRTSAHVAAKMCREHGLDIRKLAGEETVHERAEFTMNGVHTVIETIRTARSGVDAVFGFDVFGFAQGLLQERAKDALTSTLKKAAAPRRRARKK